MTMPNGELTQEMLNEEDKFEEEWKVVLSTKGEYTLSKNQANIVKEAIANGSRGMIMFQTFAISIPYISEFYRVKRFLKDAKQLPARATEEEWKPMDPEKLAKLREQAYAKIGRPMPKK